MDRQARLAAGRYKKPGISLMRYAAGGPLVSKPPKPSKPKESKAPPAPATAAAAEEKPAEKAVEEKPAEEKTAEDKPAEEKVEEEKEKLPESKKAKKRSSKSEYHFTKLSGDRVEGTHKVTGKKVIFKAKTKSTGEGASSDSGKRKHKIKITITRSPTPSDDESEKKKDASALEPVEEEKKEDKKEEKKVEEKAAELEKKGEEPTKSTTLSGEKEEEVKMPGQWKSDDWTAEQDATITKMKGENKSWKDIAIEVGASKKDVRTRFEELQKAGESTEKDKDKELEKVVEEDGGLGALGGIFEGEDTENEKEKEKEPKQPKENGKKQKQKQNKTNDKPQEEEKPPENSAVSEEKADESGDVDNAAATGGGEEVAPVIEKGLKADEIWTRDDCNVLEMLKERHHNHKWQHLQAGFFNWTGRMVAADIIQKKFTDDGLIF